MSLAVVGRRLGASFWVSNFTPWVQADIQADIKTYDLFTVQPARSEDKTLHTLSVIIVIILIFLNNSALTFPSWEEE